MAIINPFDEVKTNWAKKAENKYNSSELKPLKNNNNKGNYEKKRVAKSFKIFPGSVLKNFDKRINKMQVHFDDLDMDKNYVDSGKYILFLMAFAERYSLYELYSATDGDGNFKIEKEKFEAFKKSFNKKF